ncbi:MAG: hypothetical protein HY276_12810 [Ignavibacteriales bacterium]|nr:hypothetical protein [Ignavibacteriales bacterium]MBI3789122.1 hypothetical protein [Ignavibacteriales bacterium]
MLKSRNAKRFASVIMALAITVIANSAISFAAKSGSTTPAPPDTPRPAQFRSGSTTPAPEDTPRPLSFRSGSTTPAPEDTPRP